MAAPVALTDSQVIQIRTAKQVSSGGRTEIFSVSITHFLTVSVSCNERLDLSMMAICAGVQCDESAFQSEFYHS